MRQRTRHILIGTCLAAGCSRPPQAEICPTLEAGDLVITELRGSQMGGADTYGQWIELANRSGGELDLYGLSILWREKDGGGLSDILIRSSLVVPADEYVVLGHHKPEDIREFVDYTFFTDHFADASEKPDEDEDGDNDEDNDEPDDVERDIRAKPILDEGIIELIGCNDEVVDLLVYDALPEAGSFALDGAIPPDAETNDDLTHWCFDEEEPPVEGPQTEIGIPGTPGEANRPCN